jgi:hypothetical protein
MVVYKAANVYQAWKERGPKGAHYYCYQSGWFDACLFDKWFFKLLLPKLKHQTGKKLLISDNLSFHLSMAIINACKVNNIAFVCLPLHSTIKLQPLDVGVFGPIKKVWREVLTNYKLKNPKEATIPNTDFTCLLNSVLTKADPGRHLPAAFLKCDLHPVSKEKAMERIPHRTMAVDSDGIRDLMNSSLGERLELLKVVGDGQQWKEQGKKVPAGKS